MGDDPYFFLSPSRELELTFFEEVWLFPPSEIFLVLLQPLISPSWRNSRKSQSLLIEEEEKSPLEDQTSPQGLVVGKT